jgi:hypothetical protein
MATRISSGPYGVRSLSPTVGNLASALRLVRQFCKKDPDVDLIFISSVLFLQKSHRCLINSHFAVQQTYKVLQNFVYRSDVVNIKFYDSFVGFLIANKKFIVFYEKEPNIQT